jgi:DNA polymerase-1
MASQSVTRRTGTRRLLLVIDGDSFAHRAYHALPKTIRRRGNKAAGAILGFANVLLRLYQSERPRAVVVGWDTLDKPTYRHIALEDYQGGRSFDEDLVDQLKVLPQFVTACGFVSAKAAGYEADDFLAAAAAREERRGGKAVVATATATHFSSLPMQSRSSSPSAPVKRRALARQKCVSAMASILIRSPTSSRCAATHRIGYLARLVWAP